MFGAPPLLAEKLRQGELDAALNYWHYNARLEAEGYCEVVSAQEAARALGAEGDISAVGYLFDEGWAEENPELAQGFVAASREAKALLARDDAAWERVRPIMNAEDDAAFETLVRRYREGIPARAIAEEEGRHRARLRPPRRERRRGAGGPGRGDGARHLLVGAQGWLLTAPPTPPPVRRPGGGSWSGPSPGRTAGR